MTFEIYFIKIFNLQFVNIFNNGILTKKLLKADFYKIFIMELIDFNDFYSKNHIFRYIRYI